MEDHPPSNHSPILRTRVLKLKPKCFSECARKVKRAMLKVEGVHSIQVNTNEGTIEVNSEIDLQVLIAMAAKAGKTAELLWEPEPESPEDISTATPSLATPSTYQRQVHVSNFDQTLHLQELVDRNARGIKQMEIIDKRVIKITFKESHDDPSSVHSRDSPSPIAPPSSDSKSRNGSDGGASGSGACGNVEVAAAPAIAVEPPPKINDAPCNSKPAEPPVANVNCSSRGNSCRLM